MDFPGGNWPGGLGGRRVTVTGDAVQKHDLPLFIPQPGELQPQGIPMPAGTDLHGASARTVIENPRIVGVGD